MAFDIKSKYGTSNQTVTITLDSLAGGASRESTAIDNTTNQFLDALLFVKIKTNNTTGGSGFANIYAYGTVDGGTTYTDGATGSDAAITIDASPRYVGIVQIQGVNATFKGGPFSVAAAFGGNLPDHWGIIVENQAGSTLASSGHSVFYQGVEGQTV